MTRINLIPSYQLSDQHLIAEYRELPRVIKGNIDINDAPKKYCLGKGHVKWAKLHSTFLIYRYISLINEMDYRGFKHNYSIKELFDIYLKLDKKFKNNYIPSKEDIELSKNRITEKIKIKNNFYKWTKRTNLSEVKNENNI